MIANSVRSQDTSHVKKSPLSFNTDIVTSYLWRGLLFSGMPNIQPYFSFSKGGFQCGSWGSVSATGDYSEIDLSASYMLGNFNLLATDYYVLSDFPNANFFDYSNKTTGHSIEGTLSFEGTEKIPLTILASVYLYGADKDTLGENYYSTYFEACYSFSNLDVFVGITPWKGLYSDGAGVINAGLKLNKEIKITDKFSLPAFISLVANPRAEKLYLTAGVTF